MQASRDFSKIILTFHRYEKEILCKSTKFLQFIFFKKFPSVIYDSISDTICITLFDKAVI